MGFSACRSLFKTTLCSLSVSGRVKGKAKGQGKAEGRAVVAAMNVVNVANAPTLAVTRSVACPRTQWRGERPPSFGRPVSLAAPGLLDALLAREKLVGRQRALD